MSNARARSLRSSRRERGITAQQLWERFRAECPAARASGYEAWAFGGDADTLARLVVTGRKTATASVYALYELENEPLPAIGAHSVVLNARGEAVCIIQTTRVRVMPFDQVSPAHAYKEGEGDRSLAYWRASHKAFFNDCLSAAGMAFDERMNIVCEEFVCVYKA